MRVFAVFISLLFCTANLNSQVRINEIMASNGATIEDSEWEFDDWIELYNDGDVPLNVGGLFVSDKMENPSKFKERPI